MASRSFLSHTGGEALTVAHRLQPRSGITCPHQWTVSGLGDVGVLVLLAITLGLLARTVAAIGGGHWSEKRGALSAFLVVVPILVLWFDTILVAGSPVGDCDSVGVSGAASTALNHAGWLFCATAVLWLMMTAWMHLRDPSGDAYAKPYQASS
jgi:hypothetical protein